MVLFPNYPSSHFSFSTFYFPIPRFDPPIPPSSRSGPSITGLKLPDLSIIDSCTTGYAIIFFHRRNAVTGELLRAGLSDRDLGLFLNLAGDKPRTNPPSKMKKTLSSPPFFRPNYIIQILFLLLCIYIRI